MIFDLDGVITQTARVHAAVWKQLFDDYRAERLRKNQPAFAPFEIDKDYPEHLDGRPRYDGIDSFLKSQQIELPYGQPNDSPEQETVCGLGNRKNRLFQEQLRRQGVKVYESTVALVRTLRGRGRKVAVISASKNCGAVLQTAKLQSLFDAQVDGVEAARLHLNGKPAPDIFLEAARRLGVEPRRTVIVEDAIAGVKAGRQGGFGRVIGVDRQHAPQRLKANGADIVVSDLADVTVDAKASGAPRMTSELPSALAEVQQLVGDGHQRMVVFLDYDGTLTPIVARPEDAVLSEPMRVVVQQLARQATVAVVSGRGLADVRERVGLEEIIYAGSHGFEIAGPLGLHRENDAAQACLPALDQAEAVLRRHLDGIPGAQVERKKFSLAVHYRNVTDEQVDAVARQVAQVAAQHEHLRRASGKKVYELQPQIDWHKGKAVRWLLKTLKLDTSEVLPFYLGDDLTDEDAFAVLEDCGVGIVVRDAARLTGARYALDSTEEVRRFLEQLTSRGRRNAS